VSFRPAVAGDVDAILRRMARYYAEDGYPFDADAARAALARLLAEPALGGVWVADDDGAD
jgi:hypothetical protein